MDVALSVTSGRAKTLALEELARRGYQVASGPVLLAYPFTVHVTNAPDDAGEVLLEVVTAVDAGAGRIMLAT
ncbi:hypothetical protein [Nocardioides sp.]|uniref:hypothetical protein n=1 Tax=Nocardioides sp. TaxID=35761 RepID=UPI002B26829F|nr:hypothetical protein [Nocardioides sp.]